MTTFAAGGGKIDPEGFLKLAQFILRPGYAQGLSVTQRASGANMSVDINPAVGIGGGAMVITSAGVPYFGWIDTSAAPNAVVAAAHASLTRIDSVVLYVDLTAISSSVTNNQGATKFLVVSGTAGSGSAPNSSAIQSALTAAGATGSPYTVLANITLPAAATTVVNAYITDARTPAAFDVPYIYGGSNNTKGHLVPNQADGTIVTTTDVGSIISAMLAAGAVTPAKMSAVKLSPAVGGSYSASPPAANGAFLMMAGTDVVTFASNWATITFGTPFPNGLLMAIAVQGDITSGVGVGYNVSSVSDRTKLALNCSVNGASRVNWLAIGW